MYIYMNEIKEEMWRDKFITDIFFGICTANNCDVTMIDSSHVVSMDTCLSHLRQVI